VAFPFVLLTPLFIPNTPRHLVLSETLDRIVGFPSNLPPDNILIKAVSAWRR
jgi:hypothetical protein